MPWCVHISHHFVGLRSCDWTLPGTSNINLMVEYSIELDIFHIESCFSQFNTFVFILLFWLLFYKNLKLCEIFWSCIIWSVCWWCGVEDFLISRFLCTSHTQQYWNNQPYPIPRMVKIGYRPCQGWYTCNFEVCFLIFKLNFEGNSSSVWPDISQVSTSIFNGWYSYESGKLTVSIVADVEMLWSSFLLHLGSTYFYSNNHCLRYLTFKCSYCLHSSLSQDATLLANDWCFFLVSLLSYGSRGMFPSKFLTMKIDYVCR